MLQNYISESEGVINSINRGMDLAVIERKKGVKSNFFFQVPEKLVARQWDQKTNTNRSRKMRTNSQHQSFIR